MATPGALKPEHTAVVAFLLKEVFAPDVYGTVELRVENGSPVGPFKLTRTYKPADFAITLPEPEK